MRTKGFLGIIIAGMALLCVGLVQAQNQPAAPVIKREAPVPLGITPIQPGSTRYNVHLRDMTLIQAIEAIARVSNKKVIFSDEVRTKNEGLKFEMEFRDISLTEFMDGIAKTIFNGNFSIAWGTLGEDTWLVVGRHAQNTVLTFTPPAAPLPFSTVPRPTQPEKAPPGSTPYWFNGHQYYVVPLENKSGLK
jgi:hypothetical protein